MQGRAGSPVDSEDEEIAPGATAVNPIGLPLSQLKRLKTKFVDKDGKMIQMTIGKFVDALSSNQPPAETQEQRDQLRSELETLFKKIDASCTETVDWEAFTEYMLLHMPGLNSVGDAASELSNGPQMAEALVNAAWGSGHLDMISDVTVIYDLGGGGSGGAGGGGSGGGGGGGNSGGGRRYVTAGRDGFVKIWLPNLVVHRALDVGQHKGRWLTACCWMTKSRFLAVASTNFRIYFFDSSFSATPIAYIDHKDATPSCLGYRECTEAEGEKEILMVGDQNGFVTVYFLEDGWWLQSQEAKSDNEPNSVSFKDKKKPIRQKYHDNWVTKVGFVDDLQAMVTSGLDGEINLCNVHLNERKPNQPAIKLHKKYGVHTWCWCKLYKCFASGGLDRQIIIWNPYTQMAMNYLQGHSAPILDVQVNEAQHQLVSLSVDKVVKVWDLQHYRCIQTFTDKTEYKPEDRLTCMAFDKELPGLVLCSSTLNVLPMSVKVETNRSHTAPIIGALYNDVFHQIVSGDSMGTVRVWDIRSGYMEFQFRRAHGEHKMTCMSFDVSKRRLYTGAGDGEVRLWNWSSGQHLRTYSMRQPSEINGLLWAQTALTSPEGPNTFVVALAWDRRIYVWPGTAKSTSGTAIEPKYVLEDTHGTGHTDDISCICNVSSVGGLLATGGDDGSVVLWKIQDTSLALASPIASKLTHTGGLLPKAAHGNAGVGGGAGGTVDPKGRRRPARMQHQQSLLLSGGPTPLEEALSPSPLPSAKYPRGSCVAATQGSPTAASGGEGNAWLLPPLVPPAPASTAGSGGGRGGDAGGGASSALEHWPDEMGFEADHQDQGLESASVERLLYLEARDCLLSTHADRRARLWSRGRAALLQILELEVLAPQSTGTSSGSQDKPVEQTYSKERSSRSKDRVPLTALYSDPAENKWLFTGDRNGYVRIWDLEPLSNNRPVRLLPLLQEMRPHRKAVTQIQHFELDGQALIMAASADWTISLTAADGGKIGTFRSSGASPSRAGGKPDGPVYSMAFCAEANLLAWGSLARGGHGAWDHIIRLWSTESGQLRGEPLQGHRNVVHAVAFSPDGRIMASASDDKTLRLWDVESGKARGGPLQGAENGVRSSTLAFSPDGSLLASVAADFSIRLWDAEVGRPRGDPLRGHTGQIAAVAFSGDGRLVASGGDDRSVRLWDAHLGQARGAPLLGHEAAVRAVALSPDGRFVASGGRDTVVRLWDAATGRPRGDLLRGHGGPVTALAFSPDGRTVASGSEDRAVRLWDAGAFWSKGKPLSGHADVVFHVSFSGDGKTVISASYDKAVLLWDADSGQAKQVEVEGDESEAKPEEKGAVKEPVVAPATPSKTEADPLAHQRPPWSLADKSTWNSQPAVPEDNPNGEGDDFWAMNARRAAKAAGRGGRAAPGDQLRSARAAGLRTPRGGQLRTRPAAAAQATCSLGIFKAPSAVERFKPDPTIVAQEQVYLSKLPAKRSVDH